MQITILKLRSPSNGELQNLKIYSPAEIENGKEKEPEYRRFWNETVQKLAKGKMANKDIYKRVNHLWKLHRCKLLQMEKQELQEKSQDIEKAQSDSFSDSRPQKHKVKKITLPRNIHCVREASSHVESLDEEVRLLEQSLKRNHDMDQSKMIEVRGSLKKAKIGLDSARSVF
jgi:membrane-associated HD superfamily phosphohydrolase